MTDFFYDYGPFYVVAVCCFLAIIEKGILCATYKKLIREAKNLSQSSHPLMKMLRMKFETCYQLKVGVENVDVFVEKYLCHYRLWGFHLKNWETMANFFMLVSMIISLGSSIWAMLSGMERYIVFSGLFAGVVGNGIVLIFDCFYGVSAKKEMLKVDVVDYLENLYKPRLVNEVFHPQMLKEYRQEYFEENTETSENVVNLKRKEPKEKKDIKIEFSEEEETVIREVLREYMG